MRHAKALLVVSMGLAACDAERPPVASAPRDTRDVSNVVARVAGRPIGAADVAARMREEQLDAGEALERLIEEELLAHEARGRGILLDAEAQRQAERVMVRAMLRDFERELTPESIPQREVEEDFETHREKLQIPERRDSWHILIEDATPAGRARAKSILREVIDAEEPKTVYARYAERESIDSEIGVTVEDLPPMSRKARIEKGYKDALFAAESEGPIAEIVETSYGLHVIVLTDILPGERRTLRDVEDAIRERLSQKKRFEKLVEVVRSLEAEGLVRYDDGSVERLLSAESLSGRVE